VTNLIHSFRVLIRDKFHTLINVIGLTFGLTCSTIIIVYIHNEFSYDRYHENSERIYRVAQNFVTSGKPKKFAVSSPALGPALHKEFPQIESFVRIKHSRRLLLTYEEQEFHEELIAFADTNMFRVFTYEFLAGDPESCLMDPETIVISESMSKKYFGADDPIGKVLMLENRVPLTVSGIIADPPSNSHIPEHAFISYLVWDNLSPMKSVDWSLFEIYDFTYLLFYTDFNKDAFEAGWPDFYNEYIEEDAALYGQVYEPIFHQLEEIHYNTSLPGDYTTGNRSFLYSLVIIGIVILLLAGINYSNMSTSKALSRIREAGISKVLGACRRSLAFKFLTESLVLSLFALILALAAGEFILEFTSFNNLIGTDLKLRLVQKPVLLFMIAGITLLFSLLSSLHPAILLSRYPPSETISNQFSLGPKGMVIRRILVIFQVFLGTVAITFTLFAGSQVRFLESSELGFNEENVIMFPVWDSTMEAAVPFILDELKKMPDIVSATTTWSYPGFPSGGLYTFEGEEGMEEHNVPVFFVNFDFLETMGMELGQGRDLQRQFGSDSTGAVLINETLAGFMDWEEPLGKKINQFTNLKAQVVGVVKDFHFRSLHHSIEPLIIRLVRDFAGHLAVRTTGYNMPGLLDYMKKQYAEIVPHRPFEYFFLDEKFNQQYQEDRMQLKLISLFTLVSIIIAALGILGLVSYSVERRTREIGLRKVNGAHSVSIMMQVARKFLLLDLYAFVVAVPVTILLFKLWLRDFAFKTGISIWIVLLSLLLVLGITLVTVLLRARSASRMNPVDSIRHE